MPLHSVYRDGDPFIVFKVSTNDVTKYGRRDCWKLVHRFQQIGSHAKIERE